MSRQRNERGMASIVVVAVLIILISLISLGFAQLMRRASTNSTNRQLGQTATYAAQSGINDVIAYMKKFAKDNPSNPYVESNSCTGTDSLIGTKATPGPLYNDANLSGDSGRNTSYTCILLDQTPKDLFYPNLPELKSQVIKMTTSAVTGELGKILVSWQASGGGATTYPTFPQLLDQNSWANSNYTPVLRLTLYPVPVGGDVTKIQANSKTIFLYPQAKVGGDVPTQDYTTLKEGQLLPVHCTKQITDKVNTFNGSAKFQCNLALNNLENAVSTADYPGGVNYFYVRLMPIYGQADVDIQANDHWDQQLEFKHVQGVVDVTAKVSNVSKRLQARVDTGSLDSSTIDGNINPTDNSMPDFGLRSAAAICKRMVYHQNYYQYITTEDTPSTICRSGITVPPPLLDSLAITGNDGQDSGVTRDSQANTPVTAGCTNPLPDSSGPASGCYYGTVYINNNATISWKATDVTSCQGGGDWSGEKLDESTFTVSPDTKHETATGSEAVSTSIVKNYSLHCTGPGGGAGITKTVTAWPPPSVSISSSSYHASEPYTVTWSANNATECKISSSGNKSWNKTYSSVNPKGDSDSNTFSTSWDDTSSKSYTIWCQDPVGRTNTKTITLSTGGGGDYTINPPICNAGKDAYTVTTDNKDGRVAFSWVNNCPEYAPGVTPYCLQSSTDPGDKTINGCGFTGTGSGKTYLTGFRPPSNAKFCLKIWLPDMLNIWGETIEDENCATATYPPPNPWIGTVSTWYVGPGPKFTCDSGGHHWCASAPYGGNDPLGGSLYCYMEVNGIFEGSTGTGTGSVSSTWSAGWVNNPGKFTLEVTCVNDFGQASTSKTVTID